MAYSPDRRYLVVMQGNRFLTFDPQQRKFIDGQAVAFAGAGTFSCSGFSRPNYNLLHSPDNRLLCYATSGASATNASFVEIEVSPDGLLSFSPYLTLTASAASLDETYGAVYAFMPDLAGADGSYDLFIGQAPGAKSTACRVVKDFVPPRRFEFPPCLSVLSTPRPGQTPYAVPCAGSESISLTAPATAAGRAFVRWEDDEGHVLSGNNSVSVVMDADRVVVAVYYTGGPPRGTTYSFR
jgi:hypothetical protein